MSAADIRKAAVLLASLPEEDAARVMARFAPEEVEAVASEIARLDGIPEDERTSAVRDFAAACAAPPGGGIEVAARLVERTLGPRAGLTLERLYRQVVATRLGLPQSLDSRTLVPLLVGEHPQTIALILSRCESSDAAEALKGLPPDSRAAVVRRIAQMSEVGRGALRDAEQALGTRVACMAQEALVSTGGLDRAARILTAADGDTRRQIVESLAQDQPGLAAEIHRHMSAIGGGASSSAASSRATAA
ncbi:MAG: hypothetical protein HYX69_13195 [Planctomycetia bacterium]|nr:hypothetical protein [Planctomycetia bacterium]